MPLPSDNKTRFQHLTDIADVATDYAIRQDGPVKPCGAEVIAQQATQERDALTIEQAQANVLDYWLEQQCSTQQAMVTCLSSN